MQVQDKFKERMAIRSDVLSGKIPKRVPIYPSFTLEAACGLAGIDLIKAHYDMELREKAYEKMCDTFCTDSLPGADIRFLTVYQLLGARNWIVGSNGAVQHPEIETMQPSEYDEFTKDPYKFIIDTLLPRVSSADNVSLALAKSFSKHKEMRAQQMQILGKLARKHGFSPGLVTGQLIEAPFDFIADQLRGFKGITMDVRRCPDKLKAAVEAVTPLMIKLGTPTVPRPGVIDFIPLHLAPYINAKTFDSLYWPTLEETVVELAKNGVTSYLFAEEDWTRFADYLARLPELSIIIFENGDYKKIKEVVGQKQVIGGFFDPTITLTRSKEQCIDEVKRLMDVCMPGGKFVFAFDKGVMDIKSIDIGKLQAVMEWVHDNAVY